MRILIIGISTSPETFIQRLILGLAGTGNVIYIASHQKLPRDFSNHKNIYRIFLPEWNDNIVKRLINFVFFLVVGVIKSPNGVLRLLSDIKKNYGVLIPYYIFRYLPFVPKKWDIVYSPWIPPVDYLRCHPINGKMIISCRGSQVNVRPHVPGNQIYVNNLIDVLNKAAAVHYVSTAIENEVIRLGAEPFKTRVIRPAVDPDFFLPLEEKTANSRFTIITTGSLIWKKGYEYALMAIRILIDMGLEVEFQIIGDGSERHRLHIIIQDICLEGNVVLLGKLLPSEVRDRLQRADAFLLTSLCEGISNAVLEAMSCGLPVVTTDIGGMREAVTDGVEGFVVPVRDSLAIAHALYRLAQEPETRAKMGSAGRSRVVSDFDLNDQISSFNQLFKEVLEVD